MAKGPTLTHPVSGDTYQAVDDDHAAALAVLGWAPEGTTGHAETVDDVKARVGDDPHRAAQALAIEQASPHPRITLVEHLQALIDDHTDSSED